MINPSSGAGAFDRLYQRMPPGVARIAVAAGAGAIFAVGVALRQDGGQARRYWMAFAICGLTLGLAGGALMAVLERRAATGLPPPLAWTIVSRAALALLQMLGLALVLCLFYLMFRVVRQEHLYGF